MSEEGASGTKRSCPNDNADDSDSDDVRRYASRSSKRTKNRFDDSSSEEEKLVVRHKKLPKVESSSEDGRSVNDSGVILEEMSEEECSSETSEESEEWEDENDFREENEPLETIKDIDSDQSDGQSEKCPICLNRFQGQEIGTPEICDHAFCLDCIQEWAKKVNTCPADRKVFNIILVRKEWEGKIIKRITLAVKPDVPDVVEEDLTYCEVCGCSNREDRLLLCDACDLGYHCECLDPPLYAIPIEEWFCPDCAPNNDPANADIMDEVRNLVANHFRPSPMGPPRRVIARTRASETVRSRIERRRVAETLLAHGIAQEDSVLARVATARSAPKNRAKAPKRRYRRTYRKKKSVSSGKGGVKRRRRKKRRTKGRKSLRSWQAGRPLLASASVKKRLVEKLGLKKPPPGHIFPLIKTPSASSSSFVQGADASINSFSIFGDREQLHYFDDSGDDVELGGGGGGELLARSRVSGIRRMCNTNISKGSASIINCTQPRGNIFVPFSPPVSFDILGGILENQTRLLSSSKNVIIERDGTLSLKPDPTSSPGNLKRRPMDPNSSPPPSSKNTGEQTRCAQVACISNPSSYSQQPSCYSGHGGQESASNRGWSGPSAFQNRGGDHSNSHPSGGTEVLLGPNDIRKCKPGKNHLGKDAKASQSDDDVDIYSDIDTMSNEDEAEAFPTFSSVEDEPKCDSNSAQDETPAVENVRREGGATDSSDDELIIDEEAAHEQEEPPARHIMAMELESVSEPDVDSNTSSQAGSSTSRKSFEPLESKKLFGYGQNKNYRASFHETLKSTSIQNHSKDQEDKDDTSQLSEPDQESILDPTQKIYDPEVSIDDISELDETCETKDGFNEGNSPVSSAAECSQENPTQKLYNSEDFSRGQTEKLYDSDDLGPTQKLYDPEDIDPMPKQYDSEDLGPTQKLFDSDLPATQKLYDPEDLAPTQKIYDTGDLQPTQKLYDPEDLAPTQKLYDPEDLAPTQKLYDPETSLEADEDDFISARPETPISEVEDHQEGTAAPKNFAETNKIKEKATFELNLNALEEDESNQDAGDSFDEEIKLPVEEAANITEDMEDISDEASQENLAQFKKGKEIYSGRKNKKMDTLNPNSKLDSAPNEMKEYFQDEEDSDPPIQDDDDEPLLEEIHLIGEEEMKLVKSDVEDAYDDVETDVLNQVSKSSKVDYKCFPLTDKESSKTEHCLVKTDPKNVPIKPHQKSCSRNRKNTSAGKRSGKGDKLDENEFNWKKPSKSTKERSYRDGKPKDQKILFKERELKVKEDEEKRKEVKRRELAKNRGDNDRRKNEHGDVDRHKEDRIADRKDSRHGEVDRKKEEWHGEQDRKKEEKRSESIDHKKDDKHTDHDRKKDDRHPDHDRKKNDRHSDQDRKRDDRYAEPDHKKEERNDSSDRRKDTGERRKEDRHDTHSRRKEETRSSSSGKREKYSKDLKTDGERDEHRRHRDKVSDRHEKSSRSGRHEKDAISDIGSSKRGDKTAKPRDGNVKHTCNRSKRKEQSNYYSENAPEKFYSYEDDLEYLYEDPHLDRVERLKDRDVRKVDNKLIVEKHDKSVKTNLSKGQEDVYQAIDLGPEQNSVCKSPSPTSDISDVESKEIFSKDGSIIINVNYNRNKEGKMQPTLVPVVKDQTMKKNIPADKKGFIENETEQLYSSTPCEWNNDSNLEPSHATGSSVDWRDRLERGPLQPSSPPLSPAEQQASASVKTEEPVPPRTEKTKPSSPLHNQNRKGPKNLNKKESKSKRTRIRGRPPNKRRHPEVITISESEDSQDLGNAQKQDLVHATSPRSPQSNGSPSASHEEALTDMAAPQAKNSQSDEFSGGRSSKDSLSFTGMFNKRQPRSPSPPSPMENESYDPCEPTRSPSYKGSEESQTSPSMNNLDRDPKPPPSPVLPPLPLEPEPLHQSTPTFPLPTIVNNPIFSPSPIPVPSQGLTMPPPIVSSSLNFPVSQQSTFVQHLSTGGVVSSLSNMHLPQQHNYINQTLPRNLTGGPVPLVTTGLQGLPGLQGLQWTLGGGGPAMLFPATNQMQHVLQGNFAHQMQRVNHPGPQLGGLLPSPGSGPSPMLHQLRHQPQPQQMGSSPLLPTPNIARTNQGHMTGPSLQHRQMPLPDLSQPPPSMMASMHNQQHRPDNNNPGLLHLSVLPNLLPMQAPNLSSPILKQQPFNAMAMNSMPMTLSTHQPNLNTMANQGMEQLAAMGKGGNEAMGVMDMDVDSPYSPGDSPSVDCCYDDPNSPDSFKGQAGKGTTNVSGASPTTKVQAPPKDAFDALLAAVPKLLEDKRTRDLLVAGAAKVSKLSRNKNANAKTPPEPNTSRKHHSGGNSAGQGSVSNKQGGGSENSVGKKHRKKHGKKEVAVKLRESQLKIIDELPSSAVEMQVKEKYMKKLNRQERVVEEVKLSLKPSYHKRDISKEDYKAILRKCVPKICHNKTGEINPVKIKAMVDMYVRKYRHMRKKISHGFES